MTPFPSLFCPNRGGGLCSYSCSLTTLGIFRSQFFGGAAEKEVSPLSFSFSFPYIRKIGHPPHPTACGDESPLPAPFVDEKRVCDFRLFFSAFPPFRTFQLASVTLRSQTFFLPLFLFTLFFQSPRHHFILCLMRIVPLLPPPLLEKIEFFTFFSTFDPFN